MSAPSCPRRFDVGVYVLGALAPGERAVFDEHVRDCPACAAELRELQGLPGLLSRVGEPEIEPEGAGAEVAELLPSGLLDRVEARVRRSRVQRVLLAAACAVIVLAVGVIVGHALPSTVTPATPAVPSARTLVLQSVASAPVRGEADLAPRPWGTEIVLRCRTSAPDSAPPPGAWPVYVLTVQNPDASWQPVARWSPPPGQDVDVQTATNLPPDQVRGLEVRTGTGQVVLRG